MAQCHDLAACECRLTVDLVRSGSILALSWRGEPLLRETAGSGVLDAACFPLVPYSNRIVDARFNRAGRPSSIASRST